MKIKYPDYDNSILSIASSMLKYYGSENHHKSLTLLDEALKNNYKNVVVMLFDAMGMSVMEKNLEKNGFFYNHIATEISSVFPPTTTAAVTTIYSGLSPAEHGWLGWSLYFNELDANINIFPNTISGSNDVPAANYNVAERYIPYVNICDKIMQVNADVEATFVSKFSKYEVQSVEDICATVKQICADNGKKYIYTYWHQPDYIMHEEGTESESAKKCVIEIESAVKDMCKDLKDTLIIVTADHGMIDTEQKSLSDYPEILSYLVRLPSVESRALSFFIKEGYHSTFQRAFLNAFGNDYLLMTKDEVFKSNLFGNGDINPRAKGFIGDYLAIATGTISIEVHPSLLHPRFKAIHAGLTEDEILVPLILIDCK